jgi:hypothetical protein
MFTLLTFHLLVQFRGSSQNTGIDVTADHERSEMCASDQNATWNLKSSYKQSGIKNIINDVPVPTNGSITSVSCLASAWLAISSDHSLAIDVVPKYSRFFSVYRSTNARPSPKTTFTESKILITRILINNNISAIIITIIC